MPKSKKQPKRAQDMTTPEAVDHLFHPDMADELRRMVQERDPSDPLPEPGKPIRKSTRRAP